MERNSQRGSSSAGRLMPISHAAGFFAGVGLTLALILFSVLFLLTDTGLFHRALLSNVKWEAMEIPEEDLLAFAEETMDYFRGENDAWQPEIRTGNGLLPIAESFTTHMETVRNGVKAAFHLAILLSGAALLLLIASFCVLPGGFSRKGYLAGLLTPLLVAGGLCIIAAVDFSSLWFWLHEHFIPDGIFSAGEPIMRMFPLSLFSSYIIPLLLLLTAAVFLLLMPLLIARRKKP